MRHLSLLLCALAYSIGAMGAENLERMLQLLQQMQAQIDTLQQEQAKLRAQLEQQNAASQPPAADNPKPEMAAARTSVEVAGSVKFVMAASSRGAVPSGIGDQALLPNTIPLDNSGVRNHPRIKLHARDSRLSLRTSTSTDWGPVNTRFEIDFLGTDGGEASMNGHGLRLRHAWVSAGPLGAGQTFSNLFHPAAYPEVIDPGALPASLGILRQAGLRWTSALARGHWAVSVENPESLVGNSANPRELDTIPDLTAKMHVESDGTEWEVSTLARRLQADTANGSAHSGGGGLGLSLRQPLGGKDDLRAGLIAGIGIGRYIGGSAAVPDAALIGHRIEPLRVAAAQLAVRHFWAESVRSNLVLSAVRARSIKDASVSTFSALTAFYANTLWSPVDKLDLGIEYLYAERRTMGGDRGQISRFSLMTRYSF